MASVRWLLIVLLGFATPAYGATSTYLGSDGAAKAVQEILAKIGGTPQVLGIDIAPDKVTVLTRNDRDGSINRWTHGGRGTLLRFLAAVSGPEKVSESPLVRNLAGGVFDPAGVALDRIGEVIRTAMDYTVMERTAGVELITIRRQISIVPQPTYGDVRWTIRIKSPRESASVAADATGRIIGADLSDTVRGRALDMRRDDWALATAVKRLEPHLGTDATLWKVIFYRSSIHVSADHPTKHSLQRDYSWKLDQVTRGLVDVQSARRMLQKNEANWDPEMGPRPPWVLRGQSLQFAFQEIDFKALPALKSKAKALLELPDGEITGIGAEKKRGMAGVQWEIRVAGRGGRRIATVIFDAGGMPVEVNPHGDSVNDRDSAIRHWAKTVAREFAGKADDEKAYKRAKDLHFRVLAGAGPDVIHTLGLAFADRNTILHDYGAAAHWFRRAAAEGHAEAMFFLGILHSAGQGVEQDAGAAAAWYKQAAEIGFADAMYNLAYLHIEGKGVEQDDSAALRWFRRASDMGHAGATYTIGYMHFQGRGVARDEDKALQWFMKAVDKGSMEALLNLAFMHSNGLGTARDDRKAALLMIDAIKGASKAAVKEMTDNSDAWAPQFRIEVQKELKRLGAYEGDADGVFDVETKAAVRALVQEQ